MSSRAENHTPARRKRAGTGKEAPLGSGKSDAIGSAAPAAGSAAKPGIPGEIICSDEPVAINVGRQVVTVEVVNTGDRPITVGSHYHFAEVNPALRFDRKAAWGCRQNIIAGGMTRFEPGIGQHVELVPFAGRRIAAGFRASAQGRSMPDIPRQLYASMLGPTIGDRLHLADTDLFVEIEEDRCVGGDEIVFGGGKNGRESQAPSHAPRAQGTPDLVVTNVVIVDHWGIIKADVGIRDGRFVAIGKSGNPDIMDGVDPALVIGPSTELMNGAGQIMTAGAIDTHVHMISPDMCRVALEAGITTLVGGGTGPISGSLATLATPGPWWLERMFEAL